jgi:hypothetical protein
MFNINKYKLNINCRLEIFRSEYPNIQIDYIME